MVQRFWTTSGLAGGEIDYWREATRQAVFELEVETVGGEEPMIGSIMQQELGPVSLSRMDVNFGQIIRRTPAMIRRSDRAQFELVYLMSGSLHLKHCGREMDLSEGGCVLVDSREAYDLITAPGSRNLSFHLPVAWLQQWLPHVEAYVARSIPDDTPWGEALIATMRAVPDSSDGFGALCAQQIAGALALAISPLPTSSHPSLHALRFYNRIRTTLIDLAHETGLDAKRVAAEHGISTRYLHGVFASQRTTYSRELLSIRLERAARMLRDPRFSDLSIADISWRCAFFDASHLSRHFRATFGMTPGKYRTIDAQPTEH